MLITEINPIQRSPNQPVHHKNGGQLASGASCPAHARRSHCSRTAGRDRVATRGRGICLPSFLLPPSATTSYHNKVTNIAKSHLDHEPRGLHIDELVSEKYEGESLLPASSVRYTRNTGAPKSPSTGWLLRLANPFLPRSTQSIYSEQPQEDDQHHYHYSAD